MAKKIDWDFIKSEYEETDKSIRRIAQENGISDTAIRKKIKLEGWEKCSRPADVVNMIATKQKSLGSIASRKIIEIVQTLGDKYIPSYEPMIVIFASNYQMWLELKQELDEVGIISKTSKGTKQISIEFIALKEIEKTLKDYATELGLSVSSGMKLGLLGKPDTEKSSIFDLNKKRSEMEVDV